MSDRAQERRAVIEECIAVVERIQSQWSSHSVGACIEALAALREAALTHEGRCISCGHRWQWDNAPLLTYCGDCHRKAMKAKTTAADAGYACPHCYQRADRCACKEPKPAPVCTHGTAMDVHCCNCHSGFLFDADSCVCNLTDSPTDEAETMRSDLYAIGEALGIPAKPYSGHEAVQRDFLPRIRVLTRLKEAAQEPCICADDDVRYGLLHCPAHPKAAAPAPREAESAIHNCVDGETQGANSISRGAKQSSNSRDSQETKGAAMSTYADPRPGKHWNQEPQGLPLMPTETLDKTITLLHARFGLSHRLTCAADSLTALGCDCGLRDALTALAAQAWQQRHIYREVEKYLVLKKHIAVTLSCGHTFTDQVFNKWTIGDRAGCAQCLSDFACLEMFVTLEDEEGNKLPPAPTGGQG